MNITVHATIAAFQAAHDASACFDDKPDADLPSGEQALVQKEYNPFGEDSFHIFMPDGRVVSCQGGRPTVDEIAGATGNQKKKTFFPVVPPTAAAPRAQETAPVQPIARVGGFKLPAKTLRPVDSPAQTADSDGNPASSRPEQLRLVPEGDVATPAKETSRPPTSTDDEAKPASKSERPAAATTKEVRETKIPEQRAVAPEIEVPATQRSLPTPKAFTRPPEESPTLVPPRTSVPDKMRPDDIGMLLKNLSIAARWHQVHADWYRTLVGTSEEAQRFSSEARTHDKLAKSIEFAAEKLAKLQ